MQIVKREDPRKRGYAKYYPIRSVFDDFFTPSLWEDRLAEPMTSLSADIWEEKDNIFVKMAMPGVKKEDIKITVNEDNLSISGHTKSEEEKKDDEKRYYFRSMESSYSQSFNLPTKVDPDKIEAKFEDGVLSVKLPKAEEVKPRQI